MALFEMIRSLNSAENPGETILAEKIEAHSHRLRRRVRQRLPAPVLDSSTVLDSLTNFDEPGRRGSIIAGLLARSQIQQWL
jgi:hypothetical protein